MNIQSKISAIYTQLKTYALKLRIFSVGGQFNKKTETEKNMKITTLKALNATADERTFIHKFLGDFRGWITTDEQAKKYLTWLNNGDRTIDFEIPNGRAFRLYIDDITNRNPLTFKCKFSIYKVMKNYAGANEYMWIDIGENDNMELIFIDAQKYTMLINGIVGNETAFDHLIDRVVEIMP